MHGLVAIALHALITTCGLGVLALIGALRLRSRSLASSIALLGLGYVCGYSAAFAALTALLTVGVPFGLPTIIAVTLIGSLPLAVHAARARGRVGELPGLLRPRSRAEGIGLLVATIVFALGFATQIRIPLGEWDAWAIWTNKAGIFTNLTQIPVDTFTSKAFAFAHPDYPIGMPLWEAAHFRALGRTDTSHVMALDWLLLSASLLAAFSLAPRGLSARVAVPVIIGAAFTVLPTATTGYADVPMGLLLMLGALAVTRWMRDGEAADLRLAVVLLGGAAITKNEGLMGAIALWAAALAWGPRGGRRGVVIAAVSWAALFVAPWRAWLSAHDIAGDLKLGHALSPGYLADHSDRLDPILENLTRALLSNPTLMLIPIGVGALLAFGGSRALTRFFVTAVLLYAAALVVVYWISPYEIGWHLATSADRTFRTLGLLAVPAILFAAQAAAWSPRDDAPDNLPESS